MTGVHVGTAGWVVPRNVAEAFPEEGTHLQRYAARLNAAEINSSFYRPHRAETYARWAASVPPGFRFAVKLPKTISHATAADEQTALIERFTAEVEGLGEKLAVLLVQFPPRRAFDAAAATLLFNRLRTAFACGIACEPRHPSWFAPEAEALFIARQVARVAADPAPVAEAAQPGGWAGLRYRRLHGSPAIYRSSYDAATIAMLGTAMRADRAAGIESWCIFDNTMSSAAAGNALSLTRLLAG